MVELENNDFNIQSVLKLSQVFFNKNTIYKITLTLLSVTDKQFQYFQD